MDVRLCLVIIIKNEIEIFCNNSNFSLVLLAYRYGTDLAVHKRYLWHTNFDVIILQSIGEHKSFYYFQILVIHHTCN